MDILTFFFTLVYELSVVDDIREWPFNSLSFPILCSSEEMRLMLLLRIG